MLPPDAPRPKPDRTDRPPHQAGLSRRLFVGAALSAAALSAVGGSASSAQPAQDQPQGDGPIPDGPTALTIAHAEKLAGLSLRPGDREQVALSVSENLARFSARRSLTLENGLAPSAAFRVMGEPDGRPVPPMSLTDPGPLPASEEDIAFAPAWRLGAWIRAGRLTSRRLTELYLSRIDRLAPGLLCVITVARERALRQADLADAQAAAGTFLSPLHGVPYAAKDLFDTAGIPTTFGAEPYRDRVPSADAAVIKALDRAGAVLIAKSSLGALAYGDIWFGGTTRNPFNPQQGSSGSSAGSASGTVAGLWGFSLGTETLGSIVSPCMRCGATGLRPTFGLVPRSGAMALCWSLDKVGPITRTVADAALVLGAIAGHDALDPSSLALPPLAINPSAPADGLRVGYDPTWFEGRGAIDLDRRALDILRGSGVQLVEIAGPQGPYDVLLTILNAEAAAAFDELTLTGRDAELSWQAPQAWPNTFRTTWFVPAVELIQAERFRRRVCVDMHGLFTAQRLDAIISPSFVGPMLRVTNFTGTPSLTVRSGMRAQNRPHGITLWGAAFSEDRLCRLGRTLEEGYDAWRVRPEPA